MSFLSTNDVAEQLAISPRTVRRLIEDEKLPALRVGNTYAIPDYALEFYRRSQEQGQGEE